MSLLNKPQKDMEITPADTWHKPHYGMEDLLAIMRMLRSENGCPWDKEQTHESIRKNFLEETCEVLEAIDLKDQDLLKEELGDVLLQVVFHARIEEEQGSFSFDDVADGICKKLIERHPHVFGTTEASTSEQVLKNWDEIKQKSKGQTTAGQTLLSVPKTLPMLMRSQKVQSRAAKAGFDYPNAQMALDDLQSEVRELTEAVAAQNGANMDEELGDVLFSCVNVARFLKLDAEESLGRSCEKFIRRFLKVEELATAQNVDMHQADIDTLNALWKQAKKLQ